MYVYWVTTLRPTNCIPMLFLNEADAERDAKEQNEINGTDEWRVVAVEVF